MAVSYTPYSKQGWLFDAAPADRRHMWEDALRQLAAIQTIPVETAGFLNLAGNIGTGFDQEVDRWRRFLEWVDPDGRLVLLREGFDHLLAAAPANRPEGIVWGDARLGNMMIGTDFRVAAVMDWEQPSLGGALHDLGWWLCSDHNQTTRQGLPRLEGMRSREETIAVWSDACGKSAADIEWYESFVVFKQEGLAVRMTLTSALPPTGNPPGTGLAKRLGHSPAHPELPHHSGA